MAGCLALAITGCARAPEPPRGVVLVLIDTLRADRLGCYGYDRRPTSPRIDAFAERAVVFDAAISHAPWTLASVVSILSGHPDDRAFEDGALRRSLVEDLTAAGVRTAAFTEGGYFTDQFGLGLGFEEFHEEHYLHGGGIEGTFESALEWLERHGDEPFFLLVHTYEAHMPYMRETFTQRPGGGGAGRIDGPFTQETHEAVASGELLLTPEELDHLEALYDGGVLECDRWVGRLLDGLVELGLRDDTVVILTSDHGEELAEARFPTFVGDHGHAMYDYLVRVPLIIDHPHHRDVRRVASQVRSMDLLPTVMDALGLVPPAEAGGRPLTDLVAGAREEDRLARGGNPEAGPEREFLRWAGHKLVRMLETPEEDSRFRHLPELRLYDLTEDPGEQNDLAAERAELARLLVDELERDRGAAGLDPDALDIPPELEAELRALGYGD